MRGESLSKSLQATKGGYGVLLARTDGFPIASAISVESLLKSCQVKEGFDTTDLTEAKSYSTSQFSTLKSGTRPK